MKKSVYAVIALSLAGLLFIPTGQVLTFTETRTTKPALYYIALNQDQAFELVFTHSIHQTDVVERYKALSSGEIQLVSMMYEDVAIGMPGYAEEGQTLMYEDGMYTLSYEEASLPNFTLYIGDVDYALTLYSANQMIDLKQHLERGKSYVVEVHELSLYEKMKGVELDE